MPLIPTSDYTPPFLLRNRHVQTVFPTFFRNVRGVKYNRERIHTPDDDFLDLDWSTVGSDKVALLCHGLEGSANTAYMKGMVKAFNRRGWDGVGFNFRGCSGELNNSVTSYHSGATEDLQIVIDHLTENYSYQQIALVGFSLGGNIVLKYLGEQGNEILPVIKAAGAVSVPCDLVFSAHQLEKPMNWLYLQSFMYALKERLRKKLPMLNGKIRKEDLDTIKTFKDFDELYTAPVHGYDSAMDYWSKTSSKHYIPDIRIPTLLINASDDPFLTPECFPVRQAKENKYFVLQVPKSGGHVGFITFNNNGEYWHETRITSFITGQQTPD